MRGETTYRVGVDIGGTFTDIVLIGSDGAVHTKKISSSVEDYARAIVEGLAEVFAETGIARQRHRGDPPRHHGRLQRHPRAEGRPRRPDHHQGLPRRAGDPHAAHAAPLRHRPGPSRRRWSSAICARWSTSASTISGQVERALDPADAERAVGGIAGREGRGHRRLPPQLVRQSGARADAARYRPAAGARPAAVRLLRGAAGDQGIRAHLHDRHQRLRDADRGHLSGGHAPAPRRRAHSGAAPADAVERRAHDRQGRRRAAHEHHRIGSRRRRHRRAGAGARGRARPASSPSTWAARPPRPRWSRTAR